MLRFGSDVVIKIAYIFLLFVRLTRLSLITMQDIHLGYYLHEYIPTVFLNIDNMGQDTTLVLLVQHKLENISIGFLDRQNVYFDTSLLA